MNQERGNIFILVAPSGAGKSSLAKEIVANNCSIFLSISYTTREKRQDEIEGKDYNYISMDKFYNMRKENMLLEWEQVHDNMYGTPKKPVEIALNAGKDVLLEIDYKGARKIKQIYKNSTTIFILPPSIDELKKRLYNRAQDDNEIILKRLNNASQEVKYSKECEYVIINHDFHIALHEIKQIIEVEKLRFDNQLKNNFNLFKKLGII